MAFHAASWRGADAEPWHRPCRVDQPRSAPPCLGPGSVPTRQQTCSRRVCPAVLHFFTPGSRRRFRAAPGAMGRGRGAAGGAWGGHPGTARGCSWGCTTSPAASTPAARLGCARGALLHVRERFWVTERPGQGLCRGSGGPGSWVLLVPWMLTASTSTGEVCGHRTAHARPLLGCPATGQPKCSGKGNDTALWVPPGTAPCC